MLFSSCLANVFSLYQTKILPCLTHYQTTNFRHFQTEKVCRRQFKIWLIWQKVIQTGRKHCGKRRNCLLQAISPFPTVFSKGLFPRGVKRCHCMIMRIWPFKCLQWTIVEDVVGQWVIICYMELLLFLCIYMYLFSCPWKITFSFCLNIASFSTISLYPVTILVDWLKLKTFVSNGVK